MEWLVYCIVLAIGFHSRPNKSLLPPIHPFCVYSYDGRAKFPTALRTIDWSTSQLSLVCERATASNEQPSRLSLEWITCAPSY
ncbi:unnamed protein product [Prunus armeniaca]